jgi:glutathione peroxidase
MKTILAIMFTSIILTSSNIYNIELKALSGNTLQLEKFKGKKILIVNTASNCGFTSQYEDLQNLYKKYGEKLEIIGMPCNQFLKQEPGTANEIAAFCKKNYGVTFTMLEKADVKGKNQHPLYKWLTKEELNGVRNSNVKWNFHKFLLDEKGKLLADFGSSVNPLSEEIVQYLK